MQAVLEAASGQPFANSAGQPQPLREPLAAAATTVAALEAWAERMLNLPHSLSEQQLVSPAPCVFRLP